ncbi:hypothetical protein [Emticicia sp. SJ17W-69]|uniref:hypothetical protein n=1 Tax=Emticicia sp. SJ17W-69 TaxID=3421657 RepID=UPI003EB75F99
MVVGVLPPLKLLVVIPLPLPYINTFFRVKLTMPEVWPSIVIACGAVPAMVQLV